MSLPSGPATRVDDDERERVAAQIREHFAAGRLTTEELDGRLGAAYSARTAGELQALLEHLPPLPPSLAEQRARHVGRRSALGRQLLQQAGGLLGLFVLCTLVWALSDRQSDFWPKWIGVVALVALLGNLWRLYGPAPDLDRVEADLADRRPGRLPRGPLGP